MDKIKYFTTPIYYVNGSPHIGHAYTTIAADILARYYRSRGFQVFFLTGTDEHGQKIAKAAEERGLTPREHADLMAGSFTDLWKKLDISNDGFIRTTEAGHMKVVQEILGTLYEKGEIEKRKYTGWYCVPDERFWTQKDLVDGKCPDCGRKVENIEEENYFFLMSKYQQALISHIEANPGYIMPDVRRNEVLGFLKNNRLEDLCISRPKARLSWGIEIPFDRDYVTYVWFDALINYYSATRYIMPGDVRWWPATCHLIGKDILTTHSVYWSSMLLALGYSLPKRIFAHGWWMTEDEKMSKSLGNVVDPLDLVGEFGTDAFRFYLFRNSLFGKDASFSYAGFKKTYETELANELGNLLSRVLSMILKYDACYDGKAARKTDYMTFTTGSEYGKKEYKREDILFAFIDDYERLDFYSVLEKIWLMVRAVNRDIEDKKPWELAKNDTRALNGCLSTWFQFLRIVSGFIYPFMPGASRKMRVQMGIEGLKEEEILDIDIETDFSRIKKGDPLFPKKEVK
ncbi:MAG: methionine--tRNA ligase [Elusimicrobia bacterium]|nr:methionine--tRNA ligase [Elusimicrobiota bacterium]